MASSSGRPRSGALDAALGQRIRERRLALSLTQADLGKRVGLTFQQVQKYENGSNRVTALMLVKLAKALDLGISDLMRDLEDDPAAEGPATQRERLLEQFDRIASAETRDAVLTIVERLADQDSGRSSGK